MAPHFSILAWQIPWSEQSGELQSTGSQRVKQQSKLLNLCFIWEGNGNPLQYSHLENPMDGGAWWATVHGVAKSRRQLSDFTFLLCLSSQLVSSVYA